MLPLLRVAPVLFVFDKGFVITGGDNRDLGREVPFDDNYSDAEQSTAPLTLMAQFS